MPRLRRSSLATLRTSSRQAADDGALPGIDGEPVTLPLPVRCENRPGALRLLLPRKRPSIPHDPKFPPHRF